MECSGHLVLPNCHDQCVLSALTTRVCGCHSEVVDTNVILQWQGQYLLGLRSEGGPVKTVNISSSVPVSDPQSQVSGVTILQILKCVGRDNYPEIVNIV